jgi:uncharacterized protein YjbI with pentapeptide repeats
MRLFYLFNFKKIVFHLQANLRGVRFTNSDMRGKDLRECDLSYRTGVGKWSVERRKKEMFDSKLNIAF